MTDYVQERVKLENNLRLVLGKPVHLHSPEILHLDPGRLKRAYYHRAQECHPDKATMRGLDPEYLSFRFRSVREAYSGILDCWNSGVFDMLTKSDAQESPQYAGRANHGIPRERQKAYPGLFHSGQIPGFPLRFGQYLYYNRIIDLQTLIKSLSWQLRTRPKLGDMGIQLGYLSPDDIIGILRGKTVNELFGEAAVRLGYLTRKRLTVLAGRQLLLNLPIGRFYVDNGYLEPDGLVSKLDSLNRHNFYIRAGARRS